MLANAGRVGLVRHETEGRLPVSLAVAAACSLFPLAFLALCRQPCPPSARGAVWPLLLRGVAPRRRMPSDRRLRSPRSRSLPGASPASSPPLWFAPSHPPAHDPAARSHSSASRPRDPPPLPRQLCLRSHPPIRFPSLPPPWPPRPLLVPRPTATAPTFPRPAAPPALAQAALFAPLFPRFGSPALCRRGPLSPEGCCQRRWMPGEPFAFGEGQWMPGDHRLRNPPAHPYLGSPSSPMLLVDGRPSIGRSRGGQLAGGVSNTESVRRSR